MKQNVPTLSRTFGTPRRGRPAGALGHCSKAARIILEKIGPAGLVPTQEKLRELAGCGAHHLELLRKHPHRLSLQRLVQLAFLVDADPMEVARAANHPEASQLEDKEII